MRAHSEWFIEHADRLSTIATSHSLTSSCFVALAHKWRWRFLVPSQLSLSFRGSLQVLWIQFFSISSSMTATCTPFMQAFLGNGTYSTLTHFSHDYDSSFSHLLHSNSFLSWLWLIVLTPTPLWLIDPYCTLTIQMTRSLPVNLAWSYSNIPEF